MAGMSESKFKKVFQEAFGQSPHQYILEKKLEYANELLKSGQYTLTQIAYKLGYNHTSGFTRLYKKKLNV
jgi:AraC-like DNA-binding protein